MKSLIYYGYSLAWKISRLLPEDFAYAMGDRFADRIYAKNGKGVKRLRSNYSRIASQSSAEELEKLVQDGMRSYLRYWVDTFRFPNWTKERTITTVVCENENYLRDPIALGRGCIVALPHAGNWDHAGTYFCSTGIPLTTVAEHLEPEKLFRRFLSYRESIGMEVLDLNTRAVAVLAQRLRAGKLVALVADRDLSQSGLQVQFVSGAAKMPAGPALLAIQTGAPLITAFVKYEGKGIRIIFNPEIPVPTSGSVSEKAQIMTQEMANVFAQRISESPVDWHMLQRIWVDE